MEGKSKKPVLSIDPYINNKILENLAEYIKSRDFRNGLYEDFWFKKFIEKHFDDKTVIALVEQSDFVIENKEKTNTFKVLDIGFKDFSDSKTIEFIDRFCTYILDSKLELKDKIDESDFMGKLTEISKTFSLNDIDSEIITQFYLLRTIVSNFKRIFENYDHALGRFRLLKIFSGNDRRWESHFSESIARLKNLGLITQDLIIDPFIKGFFDGLSQVPLSEKFFRICRQKPLPIEYFTEMEKHIFSLKLLLSGKSRAEGFNLLLYGVPGTGKSEFSRALASYLNYPLFEIKNTDEESDCIESDSFRFIALRGCQNTCKTESSIILIDESDEMLNGADGLFSRGRNSNKNVINGILDKSRHICIWITNTYHLIDDSTKRRFDYSIEFKNLSCNSRVNIWQNTLHKFGVENSFLTDDIKYLSDKYETNAGSINVAVKNFTKMADKTDKTPIETMELIFNSQLNIMDIKTNSTYENSKYSLDGLNIKGETPINEINLIIKKFYENSDRKTNFPIKNMNLLFFGPSGTGKTEFAKYLAKSMDKELISKKGSDFLDKYVGGTEKSIRDAFREAELKKSILFIDEFDGLISSRENATRSWEVSQVNELLTQMEEFKGVLICATNFKSRMDAAAIRRFNFKVEFDYLDNKGKLLFYQCILKELTNDLLGEDEQEELYNIPYLTPGDYKVVFQKHFFRSKEEVSNKILISSLRAEVETKNNVKTNRIGY